MFGALICLGVALNSNFALTLTIGLTILVYLLKGWEGGITIPLLTLDSFSLFLILLSVFVTWMILLRANNRATQNNILLRALSLILLTILILAFRVTRTILFYFLFEGILIPISLIVLGWGTQPERLLATLYLLFYTITRSLPLLGIILLSGITRFREFSLWELPTYSKRVFTFLVMLPFLVKAPAFMVHLWLPKTHVEAPVFGRIVLAGVLLKVGLYGLLKLSRRIDLRVVSCVCAIRLSGSLIITLVAVRQVDVKSLIAYSRVVHIALAILVVPGLVTRAPNAALMILIGHGVCRSGLFYSCTLNYRFYKTRSLVIRQGLIRVVPSLSLIWACLLLMNLRAPPRLTLLSEVLMRHVTLIFHPALFIFIAGCIVGVLVYNLHLFTCYYHGAPINLLPYTRVSVCSLTVSWAQGIWWILGPLIFIVFE